jgi:hypothetical protein
VGVAILCATALVLFWRSEATRSTREPQSTADAEQTLDRASEPTATRNAARGGVGAREMDAATRRQQTGTAMRRPEIGFDDLGLAPAPPEPEERPVFRDRSEEIAWYKRELEEAKRMRDARRTFVERLPRVRERIEQSSDAERRLATFESRKLVVEANYAKAQARVDELERKLATLGQ